MDNDHHDVNDDYYTQRRIGDSRVQRSVRSRTKTIKYYVIILYSRM